jgi:hypothetical protein
VTVAKIGHLVPYPAPALLRLFVFDPLIMGSLADPIENLRAHVRLSLVQHIAVLRLPRHVVGYVLDVFRRSSVNKLTRI